jgi:hypothetical protein
LARRSDRRHDRGAVLIWVGSGLVALVGMGALVIDVGALYAERRVLQNGADAAALAVAKDCAEGNCLDEYGTADAYADDNAGDDHSNVPLVCGSGTGLAACPEPVPHTDGVEGWVKVDTATETDDGGTEIPFVLAPVLDAANVGQEVHASAVAAWGPVGSATTLPLIFSTCEFEYAGGSLDTDPPTFPTGDRVIYFHDNQQDWEVTTECGAAPSGGDFPGGFGWLDAGDDCQVEIDADGWVADEPGNFNPGSIGCDPEQWQDADVLLPLFDLTNGLTGNNGEYHVAGFVGFHVTGYHFSGPGWNDPCTGNQRCIGGYFTEIFVEDGQIGSGNDYGARVVQMIG